MRRPGEENFVHLVEGELPAMASERRMSMGAPLPTKPAMAGSGSGPKSEFIERGIDAVAQVLRRVDERSVEIEDQQLQLLHGNGAKNANHISSVMGATHLA